MADSILLPPPFTPPEGKMSMSDVGHPTLGSVALDPRDSASAPADAPAENAPAENAPTEGQPEWWSKVPEKFRAPTAEESLAKMGQSYSELETKLGESQTQLKEAERPNLEVPEVESAQAAFGKVIGDALEGAKVDWQGMRQRYFAYQELTDSDAARLEEAGISPAVFEDSLMGERTRAFIEYEDAQNKAAAEAKAAAPAQARVLSQQEAQGLVQEFAGGSMEKFSQMSAWGEQNLGKDAMEGVQAAINTGDVRVAQAALRGLHTAYTASQGQEQPLRVTGGRAPAYGMGPPNAEERQKIFNDPRWSAIDPASRQWRFQQEARMG